MPLIPAGMDTVVERERVQPRADGSAQITGPAPRGLNVRAAGEDFSAGEPLVPDRARAGQSMTTVPMIGIPGYPLAAAVIFELFAVPLLAALQGRPPADRLRQCAELACDWTSSPDVEDERSWANDTGGRSARCSSTGQLSSWPCRMTQFTSNSGAFDRC